MTKIVNILKSIRFWQMLIAVVVYVLAQNGAFPPGLADIVCGILGISVTIGTIDRFSEKIGNK